MTKDSNDLMMEEKFASNNKIKNCRIVYVPKKVGRENPLLINTENFDFAKVFDTIQKVGNQVEKVSNTVSNVSKNVSGVISNVKGTVSNAQQTVNKIQDITRNQPSRIRTAPLINYGYPLPPQNKQQAAPSFLTDSVYGIPLPFAFMTAALIIFIIVKLAKR